jgi:hypothetical protein
MLIPTGENILLQPALQLGDLFLGILPVRVTDPAPEFAELHGGCAIFALCADGTVDVGHIGHEDSRLNCGFLDPDY